VWTGKVLNPERKSCGFKNIRIRVDRVLIYITVSEEKAFESLLLENYSSFTLTIDCNRSS